MKDIFENVLHPNSMAVAPQFDENGKLCARVYEANGIYVVDMSPKKLIEITLNYFASGYAGAIKGSKSILGNQKMLPIEICGELNMYWFPTHSPDNLEASWLSLIHIKDIFRISDSQSTVLFKNGMSMEISRKEKSLKAKMYRTAKLKIEKEERTQQEKTFLYLNDFGKMLIREQEERKYFDKEQR